jgi:hypothetical protein
MCIELLGKKKVVGTSGHDATLRTETDRSFNIKQETQAR